LGKENESVLAQCNVIEGAYFRDILQQPDALRSTVEGFEESRDLRKVTAALERGEFDRVVLTGMGSSLYALYPLHLALSSHGLPCLHLETSELIHYLPRALGPRTLLVAVSQSGESVEIVRLLEMAGGRVPVIGVTNDASSQLARQASAVVLTRAGVEASVSCKTYVTSLAALEWLRASLLGEDIGRTRETLRSAAPAVETYISGWRQHVDELLTVFSPIRQLFVTARGPSVASALTGGLILKESARFPAEGMSCAAFRHGPFETLGGHVMVLVMAGDSRAQHLNHQLAADVEEAGGKAAVIDVQARRAAFRIPAVPEAVRPILEILPVQMVSLALAARAGFEAGRFELATKITAVE